MSIHRNGGATVQDLIAHVSLTAFCDSKCYIGGNSGLFCTTLVNTMVHSATLVGCFASHCEIRDSICENVKMTDVKLTDVVAENCELIGPWELSGIARISGGIWHRAPRYRLVEDQETGLRVGLTEGEPGYSFLACWRHKTDKWIKAGPRLGRQRKWPEHAILSARMFFEEIADCPREI